MMTQTYADIQMTVNFRFLPTKRTCMCPPEQLNCLTRQEIIEFGSTVIDVKQRHHWRESHPARFIPQVPEKFIKLFSHKGATVLDPFCGSGTTNVVALQLGRSSIGADYPTRKGALSYWMETRRCELRDNKFKRLVEKRKENARVGLIGISVGAKKYFGLELTEELESELANPPKRNRRICRVETHWSYGGKPAIVLNLRILGVQFLSFRKFPKGLPFEQIITPEKEGHSDAN